MTKLERGSLVLFLNRDKVLDKFCRRSILGIYIEILSCEIGLKYGIFGQFREAGGKNRCCLNGQHADWVALTHQSASPRSYDLFGGRFSFIVR